MLDLLGAVLILLFLFFIFLIIGGAIIWLAGYIMGISLTFKQAFLINFGVLVIELIIVIILAVAKVLPNVAGVS